MVRWPAGLHPYAGSGTAYGGRPVRPPAEEMRHFWRHTATELHAGANAPYPGAAASIATFSVQAATGPTAAGETWTVTHVQVQTSAGQGLAPLLTQQIAAQAGAASTTPPPPVPVQVWLSVSGFNVHLLAQSTQGGYDNFHLGHQPVRTGEAITVIWWPTAPVTAPGTTAAWFRLRGTRHALSVI